ncbi:MAG: NAD-dependent epimerase/dehydratase family protein [Planctomycetes bacterium]|nr:NAD-dependent epimerase/dehydratase family protein [Planctomycetota bacterium]MCB9825507.1 NAD-dependent epimerase/dehydratase family protein [Planctomycetota bacterium]MCB9900601.1 NAD-dependent epimerase/dehydratase family protein [Planctomycetota bacterium]
MSGPGSPFPSGSHLVITGGAGFVGSHMADRLLERGHRVTVVDNLCTGRHENIAHNAGNERFAFIEQDVCTPLTVPGPVACVLHLASPASPVDFARMPLEILRTGSQGTERALELAEEKGARFLLASTSEVYGDPEVFPQPESYWGRVNPIGPRSVYDEAKRYAEALTMAWRRHRGVSTQIARIFNTYGPRMRPDDGRVLPAFVGAALAGQPLPVHGDGTQTRSFSYVDDTVEGLLAVAQHGDGEPVNVGAPGELSILQFAHLIAELAGHPGAVLHEPANADDPQRREPDVTRLLALGWTPKVALREGLARTLAWFRAQADEVARQA